MDLEKIREARRGSWLGQSLFFEPEVDSTNLWAKRVIDQPGNHCGKVFLTHYQTAGRGQNQRVWESAREKNLLFSFVDKPSKDNKNFQLTLVAGIAFLQALQDEIKDLSFQVKWPNDIYTNGKKMGGILTETYGDYVVIGVGLNINSSRDNFSDELEKIATSTLIESGQAWSLESILSNGLSHYSKLRETYDIYGLAPIIKLWNENTFLLNKNIQVETEGKIIEGKVIGLNNEGFLEISQGSQKKTIISGDIILG